MFTFTEFLHEALLTELLSSPLPYRWSAREQNIWLANFTTPGGQSYQVRFRRYDDPDDGMDPTVWHLVFSNTDPAVHSQWKQFDILGTGDSIAVFATVLAVLRDFAQRVRPEHMKFTAEEPSRIKLYDRFVRMVQQGAVPGYTATKHGRGEYLITRR